MEPALGGEETAETGLRMPGRVHEVDDDEAGARRIDLRVGRVDGDVVVRPVVRVIRHRLLLRLLGVYGFKTILPKC